jgi:predicted O-methyltransferase YrrM
VTSDIDATPLLRLREGVYAGDLAIAAIVELDLFTRLGDQQLTAPEIASAFGLAQRPTVVMCDLLASLGLLEQVGDRFRASALARVYLVDGAGGDLRAYFASLRERPAVGELAGVLRSGTPAAWASADAGEDWEERLDDPAFAERITAAMDARGRVLGPELARALDSLAMRSVLDVAGGSGVYGCALLDADPALRVTVLERPPVDRVARALLARRGYDAVEVVTGDMFRALPEGHDLHLYAHVLHDWDVPAIERLLRASFAALAPGGWVVDYDAHLDGDRAPAVAAYSALLMHSTEGRCYSVEETAAMMRAAGFVDIQTRFTAGDRSAVIGRRP